MLRWVDDQLEVHEEFVGLHQVANIEATTLVAVIKDCLLRLNISLTKVRGQCYDGASNLTGARCGVATLIQAEQPNAYFTHCYGHSLNLAVSDTIKKSATMKRALDITHEITKLVKYSPRRDSLFQQLRDEMAPGNCGVRVLCPTRWTVRADTMRSIIRNYAVLQQLWDQAAILAHDTEVIARIRGVAAQMELFDFFFGLVLGESLLRNTDNLSRTLQKKHFSAAEGQLIAQKTKKALSSIRNEESFNNFWEKVSSLTLDVEVNEPALPRKRRLPTRFEEGTASPHYDQSPKDMYRRVYFEALDLLIHSIEARFDQPGYKAYCSLEALLVKVCMKHDYSEEVKKVLEVYEADLDAHNLTTQLSILSSTIPEGISGILDIISYLRNLSPAEKELLHKVILLVKLILVMPATNCTSERSFSALRCVKSYLRSTMTQERLNSLMVLYVHKDLTDRINLCDVANEFVSSSEHRQQVFGKF